MICPKCNHEANGDAKFCPECGVAVISIQKKSTTKKIIQAVEGIAGIFAIIWFITRIFGGSGESMPVSVVANNLGTGMSIRLKVINSSGKMQTISPSDFDLITKDGSDAPSDQQNQPINIPAGYFEQFTYYFDMNANQKASKLIFQPPVGNQVELDVSNGK